MGSNHDFSIPAVGSWASFLTFLSFRFSMYKLRILPNSQEYCEDGTHRSSLLYIVKGSFCH